MKHVIYNIELYPNFFGICFKDLATKRIDSIEISDRIDRRDAIFTYVNHCDRQIGFNNIGYDWPVLKYLLENPRAPVLEIFKHGDNIIRSNDRFGHRDWRPRVEQLDLFLIHHYDNPAKSTSLSAIKFNMRMPVVGGQPIPPGVYLSDAQKDVIIAYNYQQIEATERFYYLSLDKIRFRENLGQKWLNYSDTKIGSQFFIDRLEARGVQCYYYDENNKRRARQTKRPEGVRLGDIIKPWIQLDTVTCYDELLDTDVPLLDSIRDEVITNTRGSFHRDLNLAGVKGVFGLGGLHASVKRRKYEDGVILDLDVTGYYPSAISKHDFHPEHLGPDFCKVCGEIVEERATTAKGTDENQTLKLAGNSVFGMTNAEHGPFSDPACMLGITINGQLMALMLVEALLEIEGLQLIQANTDGVTIYLPPGHEEKLADVRWVAESWMLTTELNLEEVQYKRLFIRDVNNYISETIDGKRKRKGAYEYNRAMHQNHSGLVVPKGAEAFLLDGVDPEIFVMLHDDNWDFMHRINATAKNPLIFNEGTAEEYEYTGVLRYYLSPEGIRFKKRLKKGVGNLHLMDVKNIKGKRGEWPCPDCGSVHQRKADLVEHIQVKHAPKFVLANEYHGEAITIDKRAYVNAIKELARDFD